MLSIYLLQQWQPVESGDSGGALDVRLLQQFAGLDLGNTVCPTRAPFFAICSGSTCCSQQILATINATLQAKGLLLKSGTVPDATLIAAPIL